MPPICIQMYVGRCVLPPSAPHAASFGECWAFTSMVSWHLRYTPFGVAQRVGFEPTAPYGVTSFQNWLF